MISGANGILKSSDQAYKPERLWSYFTAKQCPSLAGKPKLFFIQACQGTRLDRGVTLMEADSVTENDAAVSSYKIPNHADFLIAFSTIPGKI